MRFTCFPPPLFHIPLNSCPFLFLHLLTLFIPPPQSLSISLPLCPINSFSFFLCHNIHFFSFSSSLLSFFLYLFFPIILPLVSFLSHSSFSPSRSLFLTCHFPGTAEHHQQARETTSTQVRLQVTTEVSYRSRYWTIPY